MFFYVFTGASNNTEHKGKIKPDNPKTKKKNDAKTEESTPEDKPKMLDSAPEINLDNYCIQPPEELECEGDISEDEDGAEGLLEELESSEGGGQPLHVLPLYSLLPQERQNKIFEGSPEGSRQDFLYGFYCFNVLCIKCCFCCVKIDVARFFV